MELLLCKLIVLEAFKNVGMEGLHIDEFNSSCYDQF